MQDVATTGRARPPAGRWPFLRILSAVRMALDPRKLGVALAALLFLQAGWSLLDLAFPGSMGLAPIVLPQDPPAGAHRRGFAVTSESIAVLSHRLAEPARDMTAPVRAVLDPRGDRLSRLHGVCAILWLLVVWGLAGTTVARLAVLQELELRQPSIAEAVRFAWASRGPVLLTPLVPIVTILFLALAGLSLGLVYRLPGGASVAGWLLFVPLVAGLGITLLTAAIVVGWPFFHAALAAGAESSLDAFSRTYNYISQRLIPSLAACALAWGAGLVGLYLVDLLVEGWIHVTQWSLSLSGPPDEVLSFFWRGDLNQATWARATHRFWLGGVRLLGHSWIYSYYWTAAAMIYLWLRADVDGPDMRPLEPSAPGPATRDAALSP